MTTATKTTANVDLKEIVSAGFECAVAIDLIDPSPYQTRRRFSQESLQTLAESLQKHGQLQNLIVRHVEDRYELIAGERRLRAGKLAELPSMRVLVIEADDDAARELVIIENLERENVTAVEEAAGFQQLIASGQYTQKTLAERLRRDPSFVSNRLRLLSLPVEWQQQILEGELLLTQARLLVPWADRPAVLEQVKQRFQNMIALDEDDEDNPDQTPLRIIDISCDEVQEIIGNCAKLLSRSMRVGFWDGPKFEVTDELLAQLDVVEVPSYDGKHFRAFNIELWDRLQDEAQANRKPPNALESDADDSDSDESDADDADDTDRSTEALVSRLNDWSLTRHISSHVASVLAGHIKADTIGLRTFLMVMADDGGYAFLTWICDSQGIDADDAHDEAVAWKALAIVNQKNLLNQMALFLQERLADTVKGQLMTLEQLLLVCHEMQLDPMAKWVPEAALLELCSDVQLREILIDHIAPEKQVKKWKRARMLKEAIEGWPAGYVPILLKPKLMIEAEGGDCDG